MKLAWMQTDGMLAFGGAFVTSLFALTSLLYARARAVTDAEEMAARAAIADEAMRCAFVAVIGLAITAFTFFVLSDYYQPRGQLPGRLKNWEFDAAPGWASVICTLLFTVPILARLNLVVAMTVKSMGIRIS